MNKSQNLESGNKKIFTSNNLHWRKLFHNKPNEIEKCNIKLRISQTKLNLIKENSIKDMIYSRKYVPVSWRSKSNYQDQVMRLLANDENFLGYMGNIGGKINKNNLKNDDSKYSSYNKNNEKEKYSIKNKRKTNKLKFFRSKSIDEREIGIYFNKLGKSYPIKEKLKELFDEKVLKSVDYKNNINVKQNNSQLRYKCITTEKKKNDINKNIYINLVSNKSRNPNKEKKYRARSAFNRRNVEKDNYLKRKIKLKNKYALNQLESINFYGPYFSYCPECGPRNTNFYKNIDSNILIDIIGQIKKNKDEQIMQKLMRTKKVKNCINLKKK